VTSASYTVPDGTVGPLENTATADCTVADPFGNVLDQVSDGHTTYLFTPIVEVIKSGPAEAWVGDEITYSFQINNNSVWNGTAPTSGSIPDLLLTSIDDTVLGDLTDEAPASCDRLATDEWCSFDVLYTIPADAPDPLVNVVEVHYYPEGFTNDVTDTDDHSLEVLRTRGQLTPTDTECVDFAGDTATDLLYLYYMADGSVVVNVTPGAMFYWNEIVHDGGPLAVDIFQETEFVRELKALDIKLWDSGCLRVTEGVEFTLDDNFTPDLEADLTFTATDLPAGTYYLQVRYDPKSLEGATFTTGTSWSFDFHIDYGFGVINEDSLMLVPKP
jgi:hypothetical protein